MQILKQMKMVMQKQIQMQTKTKITNSDKNAMQKWISKCNSKGTEIKCYSIHWKQRATGSQRASKKELMFNSDIQTTKSGLPGFSKRSLITEVKHSSETREEC